MLAGAGTGKTAVIIGKIAHLTRNRGIEPASILTLAFNRKAALEIRQRLPPDLKGANASTFHSFALRVVSEAQGAAPSISRLAQDELELRRALTAIVEDMAQDPRRQADLTHFVSNTPADYAAPFDFSTKAAYDQHVRDHELRTLGGELVKSFEELTIANFLLQNQVPYRYEEPYQHPTATVASRQYQPDFSRHEHGLYIEHFALDRQGRPPPGWNDYADGVRWKRQLHQQCGTTLIETYSWQRREDILLSSLARQLQQRGVELHPLPAQQLVRLLSQERLHLLAAFLNHVKSADLTAQDVDHRLTAAPDRARSRRFGRLFAHAQERYQALLDEEKPSTSTTSSTWPRSHIAHNTGVRRVRQRHGRIARKRRTSHDRTSMQG